MYKKINKLYLIICLFVLTIPFFKLEKVYASTTFTTCTLTENSYLRSTPGGTILKDVDGDNVLISASNQRIEVVENGNGYKKLKANYYSNNYVGWVWNGYLKDCKSHTTDDNYGNSLRNAGFPESYILPLQKLHAMYPNWNFVPSKTNLEWNTVINEEYYPVYKNLLCSKNIDAIKPYLSTDGASYNSGVYKQFEPNCYAPSKQTISFYMDSRNWLNDTTIFMFEQSSYNSNLHNSNSVQQILNGTFMAGSYMYNNQSWTYANTFVEAGRQKNISPIQLASRVIQEQGASGSATINMDGGNGQTYYNHFNINANGSDTQTIVKNALITAKARGWNNPYLSIIGGSETLSNGYTNVGQDTNYYQKFNTINRNNLYLNQYMANVRVLPSESISTYKSYYKSNLINSSFTFKIPVYNNMPEATTLSISGNSDNTLKSLSVSGCTLSPSFNSAVTNYTCNVSNTTKQVTVTAGKTSSYSTVNGDGVVVLNNNSTVANVVVTAANGESRTYKITINKVEPGKESPSDIISYLGYNNSNNMLSGITIGTDRSNIITNVKNRFTSSNIEIKDKNGNLKATGLISTGDKITIENGGQKTTFEIAIKGDVNGDGNIDLSDLAMIKAKMLGKINISNSNLKASDINMDGSVDLSDLAMIKAHMLGKIRITK